MKLCKHPFCKHGVWFHYKGDEVLWLFPWRRVGKEKFVSLLFSGTGEFGDARFNSLRELDLAWDEFERAMALVA
jgi:hypothetical protein